MVELETIVKDINRYHFNRVPPKIRTLFNEIDGYELHRTIAGRCDLLF